MRCVAASSSTDLKLRQALAAAAVFALLGGSAYAQTLAAPPLADAGSPAPPAQDTSAGQANSSLLASTSIRGYADVGFGRPLQELLPPGGLQDSKYSFHVADLDLFISSKFSDQWTFFAETLFTSDFSNEPSVEIDRLMVQYSDSKYLRVGFGKFNSAISWYANQFHRAKFYQTATGRPLMFADEDDAGLLPVHQIGVTAQGEIPSGSLGLHYVGEVSNGRSYGAGNEVQTFSDKDNFKALAGGVSVRPDAAPALDAGVTLYRDTVVADALAKVTETIVSTHATWVTPNFEFLNEFAVLEHTPEGSATTSTSKGFYSQLSRRFQTTRPYVRYEYQDVASTDPVLFLGDVAPPVGVSKAISAGVHFDFGVFAVVKIQYDHALRSGTWADGVHAQLALAF